MEKRPPPNLELRYFKREPSIQHFDAQKRLERSLSPTSKSKDLLKQKQFQENHKTRCLVVHCDAPPFPNRSPQCYNMERHLNVSVRVEAEGVKGWRETSVCVQKRRNGEAATLQKCSSTRVPERPRDKAQKCQSAKVPKCQRVKGERAKDRNNTPEVLTEKWIQQSCSILSVPQTMFFDFLQRGAIRHKEDEVSGS